MPQTVTLRVGSGYEAGGWTYIVPSTPYFTALVQDAETGAPVTDAQGVRFYVEFPDLDGRPPTFVMGIPTGVPGEWRVEIEMRFPGLLRVQVVVSAPALQTDLHDIRLLSGIVPAVSPRSVLVLPSGEVLSGDALQFMSAERITELQSAGPAQNDDRFVVVQHDDDGNPFVTTMRLGDFLAASNASIAAGQAVAAAEAAETSADEASASAGEAFGSAAEAQQAAQQTEEDRAATSADRQAAAAVLAGTQQAASAAQSSAEDADASANTALGAAQAAANEAANSSGSAGAAAASAAAADEAREAAQGHEQEAQALADGAAFRADQATQAANSAQASQVAAAGSVGAAAQQAAAATGQANLARASADRAANEADEAEAFADQAEQAQKRATDKADEATGAAAGAANSLALSLDSVEAARHYADSAREYAPEYVGDAIAAASQAIAARDDVEVAQQQVAIDAAAAAFAAKPLTILVQYLDLIFGYSLSGDVVFGIRQFGKELFAAGQRWILEASGAVTWRRFAGGPFARLTDAGLETDGELKGTGVAFQAGGGLRAIAGPAEHHFSDSIGNSYADFYPGKFWAGGLQSSIDAAGNLTLRTVNGVLMTWAAGDPAPVWNGAGAGGGDTFAGEPILALDAENRVAAQQYAQDGPTDVIAITNDITHGGVVGAGQSNEAGDQSNPALTRVSDGNTLMLGNAVLPQGSSASLTYVPFGSGLNPMVAVVKMSNGALAASYAVGDAEPAGTKPAEAPIIAAARGLASATLAFRGSTPKIVGSVVAKSGTSIEAWLPTASPTLFQNYPTCIQQVKDAVVAAGGKYALLGIQYTGHEWNNQYNGQVEDLNGMIISGDRTVFRQRMQQVMDGILASLASINPQLKPAVVIHSASTFVRDNVHMGPSMGLLDLADLNSHIFVAGPTYPYPDWGIHIDCNGQRWKGAQGAKVLHRVLVRRERWRPLMPVRRRFDGRDFLVEFHVPRPPIVWDNPFVQHVRTAIPDGGFRFFDNSGTVPLASIAIRGQTMVGGTFGRDVVGPLFMQIGSQATNGNAGLRDSDPAVADTSYQYVPETMTPEMSDAALNGKRYPLYNWAVNGEWPVDPV